MLLWNGTDIQRLKQIQQVSFPSLEYIEDIYQKLHVFFEIPYDTGMGRMLKLDLAAFCQRFKLQSSAAWYAIKYLEREGHWSIAEDMDIQTRIKIDIDRTALYSTDLPSAQMPGLLEQLMRTYTGIFSFPTPIDEEYIAGKCNTSVPHLREMLYQLSINHVIRYIPADHATVVYLQHHRLHPGDVQLTPKRYQLLKEASERRMRTMTEFVEEEDECRSRFLLRYFGQEKADDCGKCDVCRSAAARPKDLPERLKSLIQARGGHYSLQQLRTAMGPGDQRWLDVLRELIDRGEVPPYIP